MSDSARRVLTRFAPMVYGPTVLFAIGEGAVIPLIPILAAKLGAGLATSGLIASALVIGQLVGNLPAGFLVARLGERVTMVGASLLALVGVAGLALAPTLPLLAASVFLVGVCAAAFGLARHAFMTIRVPLGFRARALSLLGGSFRLGMFAGPFLGALLLGLTGTEAAAAWAFVACLVACVLLVGFGPDPEAQLRAEEAAGRAPGGQAPGGSAAGAARSTRDTARDPGHRRDDHHADTGEPVTSGIPLPPTRPAGVFRTMWNHRRVLSRLGLAAASLSAVRSARQVVLPLWGVSLALDAQTISLVVGVAGAIDFALFYASGQVMDRFGRLWAALPAMLLMGAGFLALSVTHDIAQASMWFAMLAAVIGVGNGLSSGILLTLGADVAPVGDPAAFLGSWRTLTDAGGAAAPVLFSAIAAATTLGVATAAMGLIGVLGALGFLRWVPQFVRRTPRP